MIKVHRIINQLLTSNCFIVYDDEMKRALIIDPGSEKSEKEISFLDGNNLMPDYIILTHEHADHTWGVNALVKRYPDVKVVCSSLCRDSLPKEVKLFFLLYYNNPSYAYTLSRVDYTTEDLDWQMEWLGHKITLIPTLGHTLGSICIAMDNYIFGGDTLLQFKPLIRKRNGGSMELFQESIDKIVKSYPKDTLVYPGHGEEHLLKNYMKE